MGAVIVGECNLAEYIGVTVRRKNKKRTLTKLCIAK